jgi:hypothetical protein
VAAQQAPPPASPFLPGHHWTQRVLRRLDHAGLLPGGADLARQTIPQDEVAALLEAAHTPQAHHYLEHFREEYAAPRPGKLSFVERAGVLGYHRTSDQYGPGTGYDSIAWTGAHHLEDESDVLAQLRLGAALAPYLAANLVFENSEVDEAQFVAAVGLLGGWVGQREIGYGVAHGGGIVLNAHALTGGGLFFTRPLNLPVLGPIRFEMHLAKIDNVLNLNDEEHEIEPWFWTARGSFEPFRGPLRIGINRGMMFGGEGNTPVTFSRVVDNIVGYYTERGESNFANQIISIDFRLRVPGIPASVYVDWGSDDAAGGWWDVPALLAGFEYVHVDSTFDIGVGAEHLQFSGTCCGNSIWYRNAWFRGGWADGEHVLGHPLGGHGREWRVFANGGFMGGKLQMDAALFARRRRDENLFTPAWQGKSTGVSASAEFAPAHKVLLRLHGELESGADDWNSSALSASLRYSF